jgi:hypothetical protein
MATTARQHSLASMARAGDSCGFWFCLVDRNRTLSDSRSAERWLLGSKRSPTAPFAPTQHEHKQDTSVLAANVQPAF